MALEDIIGRNVTYCLGSTTVQEVAQIMREDDVGAVLVIESGQPCGIITDRDITIRCVGLGLDPSILPAESIMSRGVETIRKDQGIYDAAQKMRRAQVRRLAIVDDSGNAVGLISFDDVFALLSEEIGSLKDVVEPRRNKWVFQAA